ncbi:MAG: protease [Verrucomicrobiales bacterium]|nr:protease [Verrucomicrobiales bacterium]
MAIAESPGFGFFQVPAFVFSTQRREIETGCGDYDCVRGCIGTAASGTRTHGGIHMNLKEAFMGKKVLEGKKIAILVTDGFEQVEMVLPRKALDKAGARTVLISPVPAAEPSVRGWKETKWGSKFDVDVPLDQVSTQDYDALLLPGGVINPDKMRINSGAVEFVRSFFDSHKPVAAICHGPQMLIEANVVRGRRLTSWPSLKTDLRNAGAEWVDEVVVTDGNLVTSRKPADIPKFNETMINEFAMAFAKPREEEVVEHEHAPVM